MELKIYIPTKSRVDRQVTLSRMPEELQKKAYLVCPPEEVAQHRERGVRATFLPCKERGISAVREWILKHAHCRGNKRIVMIDDDVVLQRRRKDMRITNAEPSEYIGAFKWLDDKLKTYAHASWGTRFLAYNAPGQEMEPGRAMYALGYNTKLVREARGSFTKGMPPMPVMEDFHMTLQLLKAGHPNCVSLEWRASPYASNAPGGCSTWRNLQNHNASAKRLAELHKPFVKLRQSDTKWEGEGMEGRQRLEVTVYWQKAMKAGMES